MRWLGCLDVNIYMTKQTKPDTSAERDRPVLKSRESYDSIVGDYRQALKRVQDALTLKGLSFVEAYVEGRARIAVEFRPKSLCQADGRRLIAVWNFKGEIAESATSRISECVQNVEPLNHHNSICCNKSVMLVSDVETIDPIEITPINLERLYFIEDEIDNIVAGQGSCFLSVDGRFRVLPRVSKRELCPSLDAAAIGFNERTINVVKGSAEIMDSIANDCWGVPRDATAQASPLPLLRVGLKPQGFDVFSHVSADNDFELLDVMIGPFYF